jgi:hypothetical protein
MIHLNFSALIQNVDQKHCKIKSSVLCTDNTNTNDYGVKMAGKKTCFMSVSSYTRESSNDTEVSTISSKLAVLWFNSRGLRITPMRRTDAA